MKITKNTSRWLYHIRQWHWVSAAFCLVSLLLFAGTGLLLNNDSLLSSKPVVVTWEKPLPEYFINLTDDDIMEKKLPDAWRTWLSRETGYRIDKQEQEWEEGEIYIKLPSAGRDAWVSILTEERTVTFEETNRGLIALLKDLHKGRNTGKVWSWFIDIFAIMVIIFSLTGLLLLMYYQRQRKTTWTVASTGVAVPLILILLFMHV